MVIGRELCLRAAALEPRSRLSRTSSLRKSSKRGHVPGTIAIEPDLILRLLDNVCREIARNGLTKIVLVNAHGGNDYLIHFFAQTQLTSRSRLRGVRHRALVPA